MSSKVDKVKSIIFLGSFFLLSVDSESQQSMPWPVVKAIHWFKGQTWPAGANFIPSNAINQLEMWQKDTFDSSTINTELGYAEAIGLTCMRVYLHHLAWQQDKQGFKQRMNTYLNIAKKHHIKTIFVFFDDCWNDGYYVGKQPSPKPGVHNSGWLKDPGNQIDSKPLLIDTLQDYVKDIISSFKSDKRILLWDLYNEPGHFGRLNKSLLLLKNVFKWAREVNPSQPLTSAVFTNRDGFEEINQFQLSNSDIITYHCYLSKGDHQKAIDTLMRWGRPMICTEYMARKRGSTFASILPMLKAQNIGAVSWGLVAGKTNTIYAWDQPTPDGSEPKLWYHDIFRKDGTPYIEEETQLIKKLTLKVAKKNKGLKGRSPGTHKY